MSAALAAWHYLRQKGLWLDGGGINHQGGSRQGVLPVASGKAEQGFSFSKLDASGAMLTSMTYGEKQTNQRPPAPKTSTSCLQIMMGTRQHNQEKKNLEDV